MSYYTTRANIEPETMRAIQANPYAISAEGHGAYPCGCAPHPTEGHIRFHLCDYHEGYDEGVAMMRERLARGES